MNFGDKPEKSKGPRELPPAGTHLAILYRIVDAGWCENEYQGKKTMRTEVRFDFELWPLGEDGKYVTMLDGRPFAVAPGFLGWLTKGKMEELLKNWRGNPQAEAEEILGQACFLTIAHKAYFSKKDGTQKVGEDIVSISPIPDMIRNSITIPEMVNPPMIYSIRQHDADLWEKLPIFIRKHIADKSENYQKLITSGVSLPVVITELAKTTGKPTSYVQPPEEDIPF